MRTLFAFAILAGFTVETGQGAETAPLPKVPEGWTVELAAQAPTILFPTAIVAAPDGTLYIGQDPMDMPGPPTVPNDSIVAWKNGRVTRFADKLWSVMGLEWADGTLYVVHAPFLSAFRDTNGDGVADVREDLMTGLGPKLPGFSGVNDHIASGVRLGMDGFLYISVGDKGIPRGVGKDGTTIQLHGGGVIRIRPNGTGLEVVSTGERNPLSVALNASDEIFTYGNDDDSKRWPNSLTHHIFGGRYGYPYDFLLTPKRALPIVAGQMGGSGAQGICYEEDGLPARYRGSLFFCDWGLSTVFQYELEKAGGTFRLASRKPFVTKGEMTDFRPFSLASSGDGSSLWLVDWAYNGWLADGPKTGRLFRLSYRGQDRVIPAPRPFGNDPVTSLGALDHPARTVRLAAQRAISRRGQSQIPALIQRLGRGDEALGRSHALWALDAIGGVDARGAIRRALADPSPEIRLQAARSAGVRKDREALKPLLSLLHDQDAAVRRESAIALGRLGDPAAGPALLAALGESDGFAGWSIRQAIRSLGTWDEEALVEALHDPKRQEAALRLTDEAWAVPVVRALARALQRTDVAATRLRIMANLAGLYHRYPAWSGNWFGTNPLAGQLPHKTERWSKEGMAEVVKGLNEGLKDSDADVRYQAIAALREVGREANPSLRGLLGTETNERNLVFLAQTLRANGDAASVPALANLLLDAKRSDAVRAAALDALGGLAVPQALQVRFALVFDPKAPVALVALAIPALVREGALPLNDLAGMFFEHASPLVRAAAINALEPSKALSPELRAAIVDRLGDKAPEVRAAAMSAVGRFQLREAIPRLVSLANDDRSRSEATAVLCDLPDPQALPVYLAAIQDRSQDVRKRGEQALVAIRESVQRDLETQARSGRLSGVAALALERVLTRFQPVVGWRVIGPFARTTAQVFVGETSIDFGRTHSGAEGRTIAWGGRSADPETGRVVIDDFKGGAGDRGGFGYDTNGSPDLCAFGYAEVSSEKERTALLLVGSSGSVIVTVNEAVVHRHDDFGGRAYSPDTDLVRVPLKKGRNRILVVTRQGIGVWSFSVQVSEPSTFQVASQPGRAVSLDALRAFAMTHQGDPRAGEAIFFDTKGVGCVKCHAAAGQGNANLGPDLAGLALKYDKTEIIRSVLEPSTRIATGYQPAIVALKDGKVITGLVRAETDAAVDLIDADGKTSHIEKRDVDERRVGNVSVMPTGLVDALTPVEFADLISYLLSLKGGTSKPSP